MKLNELSDDELSILNLYQYLLAENEADYQMDKEYIEKYRERNFVIGSKVKLAMGGELSDALVKDIDDNCRLLVELPDGSSKALTSGEISISQK